MEKEKEGSNEENEVKEMKVQNKDKSKQVILEAYKQHYDIQEAMYLRRRIYLQEKSHL